MNTIKCFYTTRRFYTTKNFDKVLGLDFPSSRMKNIKYIPSDKAQYIKTLDYLKKNSNKTKNINYYFDPILGLDFPSSRFK
jgi:hypothetical protein